VREIFLTSVAYYMQNIFGLTQSELRQFVVEMGEEPYRGNQLFHWLYHQGVSSYDEMVNIGKSLREKLEATVGLRHCKIVSSQYSSSDGTTKFLFQLHDSACIESVLIPSQSFESEDESPVTQRKRLTLCISTQVGCALDCQFCATGTMGFKRNLTTGEIVDQVLMINQFIREQHNATGTSSTSRITNVVFMGMGEPLLNFDNVLKSVEIFTTGIEVAARHITISTAGIAENIIRFADSGCRAKLAISLHSLNNSIRERLMPITKKYSVEKLLESAAYYYSKTKERITFEYILFDGVNDTENDIRQLTQLARRLPCKVNIIPFHSITFTGITGYGASLRPTPAPRMETFIERLREAYVSVFVRSSAGDDIQAACGQLAFGERLSRQHRLPPRQLLFQEKTPTLL